MKTSGRRPEVFLDPIRLFAPTAAYSLGTTTRKNQAKQGRGMRQTDEKFSFLSRKINKQKLKNRTVCKETINPEKSHCIFSENVVQSWCKKSCFKTRRIGGNQYEKETCSCPGGLYDADHVPGFLRLQRSALRRRLFLLLWRRHQCGHRYRRQGGRNQPDLHHRRRPGYLLWLRRRAGR